MKTIERSVIFLIAILLLAQVYNIYIIIDNFEMIMKFIAYLKKLIPHLGLISLSVLIIFGIGLVAVVNILDDFISGNKKILSKID